MILQLVQTFGYLALFGLLCAGGLAVPIPEEAIQLTAGVLAHEGYLRLPLALAACWAGIVVGDLLWFTLARRHGERVLEAKAVARILTPERRAWVEGHLARHAFLAVAVARHTSGLRLAAFALAATHGVRTRTFALADALSALLSVPLVVGAGYLFSHKLAEVHRGVRGAQLAILAVVLLAVALAVYRRRRRRRGGGWGP